MPNHITNIVSINMRYSDEEESDYYEQSDKLNLLYKNLKSEESKFDFNAVLPQPEGIYRGDLTSEAEKEYPLNWYSWNTENWGTKWNAYSVAYLNDSYDDDTTVFEILVKFETAWNPPMPIFKKLAEDFDVELSWRDEGDDIWHGWETITADDKTTGGK